MFENFPTKKRAGGQKLSGKDFLAQAAQAHEALFATYAQKAEEGEFTSFEDFYTQLEKASSALMIARCKESFANGKKFAG
jgi:hypothetical protein